MNKFIFSDGFRRFQKKKQIPDAPVSTRGNGNSSRNVRIDSDNGGRSIIKTLEEYIKRDALTGMKPCEGSLPFAIETFARLLERFTDYQERIWFACGRIQKAGFPASHAFGR